MRFTIIGVLLLILQSFSNGASVPKVEAIPGENGGDEQPKAIVEDPIRTNDVEQYNTDLTTPHDHGSTHHHHTDHPPGHSGPTHHPPEGTHPPGHGGGHDMKMYFHTSDHATILFQTWHTMTGGHIAGSAIVLAVISVLYEGFKVLREYIMVVAVRRNSVSSMNEKGGSPQRRVVGMCSGWHVLQSFLHFIQVFVGYCLMLVFMTYNVWLCLGVSLGMMFGYFFFAWMKPSGSGVNDPNDCCA